MCIAPIFIIELHVKDYDLLKEIMNFFEVGSIIKRFKKAILPQPYSVQSISALKDVIIPHFNPYNLLTQKKKIFVYSL